jgi:hypothetical protein
MCTQEDKRVTFRKLFGALAFSRLINKSFDDMVRRDFASAMQKLDRVNVPEGKIWYYELLMGECLYELGKVEESGRHFGRLSELIAGEEFNIHEKCHVSLYLFTKYKYRNLALDRKCEVSTESYRVENVRDRIRRYMPLA